MNHLATVLKQKFVGLDSKQRLKRSQHALC
jgi:hypothetical protein